MIKLKKKRKKYCERGSITVFLTMILIPTIVLSGLLTDLARIKLYSNQALVTSDNYAEAVLTQYDNVLKELYGLFAIRQDEDAMDAIETLQNYMKTSFDPSASSVEWKHLQNTAFNKGKSYDGFMPYKSADLKLDWEVADVKANLANEDVLATQIGDFMRYRVVEEGAEWILDLTEQTKNMKADIDVVSEKNELDKVAGDVMEAQKAFYRQLEKMNSYGDYLKALNSSYQKIFLGHTGDIRKGTKKDFYYFNQSLNSSNKENQERYDKYITAAEAAANGDTGSEKKTEEQDGKDSDKGDKKEKIDLNKEGTYFLSETDDIIDSYRDIYDGKQAQTYPVNFSNYQEEAQKLDKLADDYAKAVAATAKKKEQMEQALSSDNVSDSLKESMEDEVKNQYGTLLDPKTENDYKAIAQIFLQQVDNDAMKEEADLISECLEDYQKYYLRYYYGLQDSIEQRPDTAGAIQISRHYKDFKSVSSYAEIYRQLEDAYGQTGNSKQLEKKAKSKKKEAEKYSKEAQENLKKEEEKCSARNIPSGVGIGKDGKAKIFDFSGIIESAKEMVDTSGIAETGNELLLKIYTTTYDCGMFSDRVTEKKDKEAISLTDYPISENINYLYGAELEYLFGGFKNSNENLKQTRNQILTFRASMNMIASFTISDVNTAINEISSAFMEVPPLAIAVNAALRLGFTAAESYGDWRLLKDGKSVAVMKMKLTDLSAYDSIVSLLPGLAEKKGQKDETKSGDKTESSKVSLKKTDEIKLDLNKTDSEKGAITKGTKTTLKLNYEQYMVALLLLFTSSKDIIGRTGDLICLNVNNVTQGSDFSKLTFTMDKAVTAVKASCSVHLNYAVMPDGFAKTLFKEDEAGTYKSMKEVEKHYYKYSIVRGY